MSALLYGTAGVGAITLLDNVENLFGIGGSSSGGGSSSSSSSSVLGLSTIDWLLIGGGLILVLVLVEK